MQLTLLKSKIHGVTVTQAELDYIGSITIDEDLMDAAGILENEQVHVLDKTSGARLITYTIKGSRGSGIICMNGPAAHQIKPGHCVIIVAYAQLSDSEALNFKPKIVFPNPATNTLNKWLNFRAL